MARNITRNITVGTKSKRRSKKIVNENALTVMEES